MIKKTTSGVPEMKTVRESNLTRGSRIVPTEKKKGVLSSESSLQS